MGGCSANFSRMTSGGEAASLSLFCVKKMNRFWRQALTFTLIGSALAAIDLALYVILTTFVFWCHVHYIMTSVATSLVGITIAFLGNKRWTFRQQTAGLRHYIRFATVYGLSIVWQNLLL